MFTVFEFALPALSILPVEMLAMILRYLSPESLFNAALTNKHFMKVCRGDPVLRERIRLQIKREKELQLQAILDAKRGIIVVRNCPPRIFSSNAKTSIVREKVKTIRLHTHSGPKVPQTRAFKIVPEAERTNGGGKVRKQRKERNGPYKNVRC